MRLLSRGPVTQEVCGPLRAEKEGHPLGPPPPPVGRQTPTLATRTLEPKEALLLVEKGRLGVPTGGHRRDPAGPCLRGPRGRPLPSGPAGGARRRGGARRTGPAPNLKPGGRRLWAPSYLRYCRGVPSRRVVLYESRRGEGRPSFTPSGAGRRRRPGRVWIKEPAPGSRPSTRPSLLRAGPGPSDRGRTAP